MYEAWWGQTLCLFRRFRRLSQEEVLAELNHRTGRNISRELFDGMEKGIENIDNNLFDEWIKILQCDKVRTLKWAQELCHLASKSEAELCEDARRELDYLRWKREQGIE